MKKRINKIISFVLALMLTITTLPLCNMENRVLAATNTLSNPRIIQDYSVAGSGQKVTWDCIWFGNYPQAEVIPSDNYNALNKNLLKSGDIIVSDNLYNKLKTASIWTNNDVDIDGCKYHRIRKADVPYENSTSSNHYHWSDSEEYHYFKYEPIKWRILNVNENDAFILADEALDCQKYDYSMGGSTWESCTIRSWLNGYGKSSNTFGTDYTNNNFIQKAFSDSEQSAIKTTLLKNNNIYYDNVNGGNNTNDKVFLLSDAETCENAAITYGFHPSRNKIDEARWCKSSTYAKAMGSWTYLYSSEIGNCYWALRSPGMFSSYVACVDSSGFVDEYGKDVSIDYNMAVRPALHLDLSYFNTYSYAGTVSSVEVSNKANDSTSTSSETNADSNLNNRNSVSGSTIKKINSSKKALKITWKKVTGIKGYQIQYSTSSKFKNAKKITIKKSKITSRTIKKLKAKKKYYVRIRTYKIVNGKKKYSSWSKKKSKKTK